MARKSSPPKGPRASWRGEVRMDLVTFPVHAINSLESGEGDVHFHQLHAACHNRIQHQKVCPIHGEVPNDEIVSGYEYKKGKYVEIDPEELDALRTKAEKALSIDTFIESTELDPLYYDGRHYYLVPDSPYAQEPYAVMCSAMEKMRCYGIGQVVFSGREHLKTVFKFVLREPVGVT